MRWSAFAEIAGRAVQPLAFVLLARFLTPEDFGVVAAAAAVIGFAQVLCDAGLSKALVQRRTDIREAADVAFWLMLAAGTAVSGALFMFSDRLALAFFADPRVGRAIDLLSVQLAFASAAAVPAALMEREMKFRQLSGARAAAGVVPLLVALPLAAAGDGYWALVAGTLAGFFCQAALIWRLSEWRPRRAFDPRVALGLLSFGRWITFSGILGWFYVWVDLLVIGAALGTDDMGLYRTATLIVMSVFGLIFGPFMPVLYSYFSLHQADAEQIRVLVSRIMRLFGIVSIPVAFLIYALAEPAANLLFEQRWHRIGPVIGALAVVHGFAWIVAVNGEAYRAIGRPHLETWIMFGTLPAYLITYILVAPHGLAPFLAARVALMAGSLAAYLWIARRVLHVALGELVGHLFKLLALSAPLLLFGEVARQTMPSAALQFVSTAIAGLLWIGAMVWLADGPWLTREIKPLLRPERAP